MDAINGNPSKSTTSAVEPDNPALPLITVCIVVLVVVLVLGGLGLRGLFTRQVRQTIHSERLAVPNSVLVKERERVDVILSTGVDPETGSKGLPIKTAIDRVVSNPALLEPWKPAEPEVVK